MARRWCALLYQFACICKVESEGAAVKSVLAPWPQGEGAPFGASGVLLTAAPTDMDHILNTSSTILQHFG